MPARNTSLWSLLLARDTHGLSTAAGGASVLTTDTNTPVVTNTSVGTNLLQSLEVITKLDIEVVGELLRVLAVLDVLLPVKEPVWDSVLTWVLHDGDELLDFIFSL